MRLLLLKQDEITVLEESLDRLDSAEDHELFLGCLRHDANAERRQVISALNSAMSAYGKHGDKLYSIAREFRKLTPHHNVIDDMIERSRRMTSLPKPRLREIENLRRWIRGTACLGRQETAYLDVEHDLVNLTGTPDSAISYGESVVEDCTAWFDQSFGKVCTVHSLLSGSFLRSTKVVDRRIM